MLAYINHDISKQNLFIKSELWRTSRFQCFQEATVLDKHSKVNLKSILGHSFLGFAIGMVNKCRYLCNYACDNLLLFLISKNGEVTFFGTGLSLGLFLFGRPQPAITQLLMSAGSNDVMLPIAAEPSSFENSTCRSRKTRAISSWGSRFSASLYRL